MKSKIIYSDNSVLSDLSFAIEDYQSGSQAFSWVAAEDALYIGSKQPFTSKYFKFSSANAVSADMTVKYWDGSQFRAVADLVDKTSTGGASFGQDGYIEFITDDRYSWAREDTMTNDTANIAALDGKRLYDMYWLEITFDGAISCTLDWMGDLLCTETDLTSIYPHFADSTFLDNYESSKTDWEEQRKAASDHLIADLNNRGIAESIDLLLDKEQLYLPCVYKTAELIFLTMGEGYEDAMNAALENYKRYMQPHVAVDANKDGRESRDERGSQILKASR